ncbi:MAG: tRNA (adenosine(37)-N6)-threonylcarbamoyltransferase complex ATPase subunit type 1 TsaE [Atribacterota bacterium]|nr:tRNA (adenosine(37)-N6)-threonylcarbamoyltransferase complex ATPase subunit type 1 TsaE [Candidatus Atribacteria bacterium]
MKSLITFRSLSEDDTRRIAGELFEQLFHPGDLIILSGPLGAGKTYFVKGLAQAMGIPPKQVVSPTFALMREYFTPSWHLYHLDFYRLHTPEEAMDLCWEEALSPPALIVIEWGEKFLKHLPRPFYLVHLTPIDETLRQIEVEFYEKEE